MEERSLQPEQECGHKGYWPKCYKALNKAGDGVLLALCELYSLSVGAMYNKNLCRSCF